MYAQSQIVKCKYIAQNVKLTTHAFLTWIEMSTRSRQNYKFHIAVQTCHTVPGAKYF